MKKMMVKEMATKALFTIGTILMGMIIGVGAVTLCFNTTSKNDVKKDVVETKATETTAYHPHASVYYNDEYLGEVFLDYPDSIKNMYYTKLEKKKGVGSFDDFLNKCIYDDSGKFINAYIEVIRIDHTDGILGSTSVTKRCRAD